MTLTESGCVPAGGKWGKADPYIRPVSPPMHLARRVDSCRVKSWPWRGVSSGPRGLECHLVWLYYAAKLRPLDSPAFDLRSRVREFVKLIVSGAMWRYRFVWSNKKMKLQRTSFSSAGSEDLAKIKDQKMVIFCNEFHVWCFRIYLHCICMMEPVSAFENILQSDVH